MADTVKWLLEERERLLHVGNMRRVRLVDEELSKLGHRPKAAKKAVKKAAKRAHQAPERADERPPEDTAEPRPQRGS